MMSAGLPGVMLLDDAGAVRHVAMEDMLRLARGATLPLIVDHKRDAMTVGTVLSGNNFDAVLARIGSLALDLRADFDQATLGMERRKRLSSIEERHKPPPMRVKAIVSRIAGLDIRRFIPRRTG